MQDPYFNSKLTLLMLQELEALNKEHKEFVRAYGNVEDSSLNIERQLRQVVFMAHRF